MSPLLGLTMAGLGALWLRNRQRVAREDLSDQTVLITGGSRGLGLILARQFAAAGAKVAICARDPVELERARADLLERGATVLAMICDVTQREQVEEMMRIVEEFFGPVDVLVNNAGIMEVGPVEAMTLADYDAAMATHFYGPLFAVNAVLPEMRQRRHGHIVNIASIGARIAVPHLLPYCASKFALAGWSEGLRAELAKDGIQVTTVHPGLMRTGSPLNAIFKSQFQKEFAWFVLADSLPGASISAERAARQIVAAVQRGQAELIISLPAQIAIRFAGLFPGLTSHLMTLVNGLLPGFGGIGEERMLGKNSRSGLTPKWVTALTDQAAVRNNEVA